MPLKKSLKVMCLEVGLLFAVLAIATHLTVNAWEYFVLRSELCKINSSLHVLKDTISSISLEYYRVNKELDEINAADSGYMPFNMNKLNKINCGYHQKRFENKLYKQMS